MRRLMPSLWGLYAVAAIILLAASYFIPVARVFLPGVNVTKPDEALLGLIKEMTQLIVALNTSMMAAAAALTIRGSVWSDRWSRFDSGLIVAAFASGAVSYFGVYFGYVRLLTMVGAKTLNPLEAGFLWSIRLQYYGTIVGVFLVGLVFARMLEGRLIRPVAPASAEPNGDVRALPTRRVRARKSAGGTSPDRQG